MENIQEQGFVREAVVVILAILILAYFNIDIQTAANFIKGIFHQIINLFN